MDATSITTGKQSYNLNNYVDCEPFYPKNITSNETTNSDPRVPQFPHITLEDSTRTQYVPQVKILKRPKEGKGGSDGSGKLSPVKNSLNNGKSNTQGKSYEEREANYAKVRLRIMGSAAPTYDENEENNDSTKTTNTDAGPSSRMNGDLMRGQVDVPILRQPQGPDGSKGFTVKR
ncbi:hypothetical protein B4U80_07981 [Leptotrombidium deliense]|uniref:SUZ RNA-binding domain-containing n=1 Tax=Leptotrombidium deliense TaxID=299467 RepID=A0A443SAH8_9ACAR|nr:hypothetical protein B4U80_07981 [Leptotrombidium deliense]